MAVCVFAWPRPWLWGMVGADRSRPAPFVTPGSRNGADLLRLLGDSLSRYNFLVNLRLFFAACLNAGGSRAARWIFYSPRFFLLGFPFAEVGLQSVVIVSVGVIVRLLLFFIVDAGAPPPRSLRL